MVIEMDAFRDLPGAVYVLENAIAKRVKVGMTINNVAGRLEDVNNMWLEVRVTCQICGGRRLVGTDGLIPEHVISGIGCSGSNSLPLESDVKLAELHLLNLRTRLDELTGSEKGSVVRKIKTLEKRIELYKNLGRPVGRWKLSTAFYTKSAERVELLAHKLLSEHLDKLAQFGEVFCCSVPEAVDAVEAALSQLGLLESVRRHNRQNAYSI